MPYPYKKYYRYNRKRNYYRYKKPSLYKEVAIIKKKLQERKPEWKFLDGDDSSTVSSTGSLAILNGMTKGDNVDNREGREIRCKALQFLFKSNLNVSAVHTTIRYMFIIDKAPNGSILTAAEILDNVSLPTSSLKNLDTRKRLIILKDALINLSTTGVAEKSMKIYLPMNMLTVFNSGNAGTIADIESGALYLFMISDEATYLPTVTFNYRLRFIDN